ncbi:O-antigen ligase family protein [Rufibacter glacialis]|uniref:O-antigen ligase family protein n=1 Tax=Rufibacter glacialis TaxID=1259555 RepID=A0A5M8Q937_9BACT|nr:O-antigen ligase family protein [Rufibacter glacialis]KAA6432389.1 O-antigen ligase family protein [Rufibacter glacialis]
MQLSQVAFPPVSVMIVNLQDLNKKEKGLYLLVLLFFTTLFFAKLSGVNAVVTGILVLYCFWFSSFREKWETLKQRPYIQGMLLFYFALVVSTILSDDIGWGLHNLKIRLPLLLFPASIGLLHLQEKLKERILLSYAIIATLVALFCFVTAVYTSDFFSRPEYLYNDSLTAISRQQSIYVALAINIAIFIFARHIFFRPGSYKGLMCLAVVFLFGFSYLLASRIMFAVLLASSLGFSFYYIIRQRRVLEGITLVLGMVIGTVVIHKLMPSTFNRYKELTYQKFDFESRGKESHYNMEVTPDQWNGANFRLAAWTCGWEVFQKAPLLGVGLGDKETELIEKYQEKKFYIAIETDKNVHNNYLDILFSLGIIGFLIFLSGWLLLPILYAYKTQNSLALLVVATFAIAWITEVYFGKNFGTMLVGFFVPFVLISSDPLISTTQKRY